MYLIYQQIKNQFCGLRFGREELNLQSLQTLLINYELFLHIFICIIIYIVNINVRSTPLKSSEKKLD